jgi:hypothetical protein
MAIKNWILDDPITPDDLNRLELAIAQANLGGTTTGTATNLTAAIDGFTLVDYASAVIKTHVDLNANATLNVNGAGAVPLFTSNGTPVSAGTVKAGSVIQVIYNASNSRFYILGGGGVGYEPVNKAGDTMTGSLKIDTTIPYILFTEHSAGHDNEQIRIVSNSGQLLIQDLGNNGVWTKDIIKINRATGETLFNGYVVRTGLNTLDDGFGNTNLVTTFTATIPTTGWTGSAPYTITLPVTGLRATAPPNIGLVLDANVTTAKAQKAAAGNVSKIITAADSITVTCFDAIPTTAIPIQIVQVR